MSRPVVRGCIALLGGLTLLVSVCPALAQADTDAGPILNAVMVEQVPGQAAFTVTAYVTVLDAERQPITTLLPEDFTLSEDGTPVELLAAGPASQGADIVLTLDTSASMVSQGRLEAVQEAAIGFVESLSPRDRVAILSYHEATQVASPLSQDHSAAANSIALLEAQPDTGTCLYDAAYKAAILAAADPQARHAVVLLSGGADETTGSRCSAHTAQEVIELASGGTSHSPIYAIGVGEDVNEQELNMIADGTGGVAMVAADAGELAGLLANVGQQLRGQYALSYRSSAAGGEQHSLSVTVTLDSTTLADQRAFILPEPTLLTLRGLADGDSLAPGDSATVEALLSGPGEIRQALFRLDGEFVGEARSGPFAFGPDIGGLEAGGHTLTVEVELSDGQRLTQEVDFNVLAPLAEEAPEAASNEEVPAFAERLPMGSAVAPADLLRGGPELLAVGAAALAALAVLALVNVYRRPGGKVTGGASRYAGVENLTRHISLGETLATLAVLESPSLLPDQPFDIGEPLVRLGSAADNDIVVPGESIAPRHAEIRLVGEQFRVYDLGSEHGTLVNDQRVGPEGLPLEDGDELSLGQHTRLSFKRANQAPAGSED